MGLPTEFASTKNKQVKNNNVFGVKIQIQQKKPQKRRVTRRE